MSYVTGSEARDRLKKIVGWCNAYPEELFVPVSQEDMQRAFELLKENGISIGAIHGQWARHLMQGIKKIAEGGDG